MYAIPREEQDAFALRSQQRAARAAADGPLRRGDRAREGAGRRRRDESCARDEHLARRHHPRLAWPKLPPVFKEEGGTVTAGNSSGITDGAAAMVGAGRGPGAPRWA